MLALAAERTFNAISIRDQLIGPAVDYEVQRCCMVKNTIPFFIPNNATYYNQSFNLFLYHTLQIMVPVQSNGVWWCYAIDQKQQCVFVIDPHMSNKSQSQVIAKHSGTITIILDSLKTTINSLFDGWQIDVNAFQTAVVKATSMCERYIILTLLKPFNCPHFISSQLTKPKFCCSSESAFYTLYCMKTFDGDKNIHVTKV
jgi:hypothetical protein